MKLQLRNWIYLTPRDSAWPEDSPTENSLSRQEEIALAVREAMSKLREDERRVVEQHHFESQTFSQIARESGKSQTSVANLHDRALRSLRKRLMSFARDNYGIATVKRDCPLCNSPQRAQIDELIATKQQSETNKRIIQTLKRDFGIIVVSPQTIVGHCKYHG
jgi:hypothetical protein